MRVMPMMLMCAALGASPIAAAATRRCRRRRRHRWPLLVRHVRMPLAVRVRVQIVRIVAAVEALRFAGAAEATTLVVVASLQPIEVLVQGGRGASIAVAIVAIVCSRFGGNC